MPTFFESPLAICLLFHCRAATRHPVHLFYFLLNYSCSSTVVDAKIPSKEENIPTRREIFRRVIKPDKDVVASENGSWANLNYLYVFNSRQKFDFRVFNLEYQTTMPLSMSQVFV